MKLLVESRYRLNGKLELFNSRIDSPTNKGTLKKYSNTLGDGEMKQGPKRCEFAPPLPTYLTTACLVGPRLHVLPFYVPHMLCPFGHKDPSNHETLPQNQVTSDGRHEGRVVHGAILGRYFFRLANKKLKVSRLNNF